jgi:hypothetical protein
MAINLTQSDTDPIKWVVLMGNKIRRQLESKMEDRLRSRVSRTFDHGVFEMDTTRFETIQHLCDSPHVLPMTHNRGRNGSTIDRTQTGRI